jgi:hypothetical protein
MFESWETTGLFAISLLAYALFLYWYAAKNRKFDAYVRPRIFRWPVKFGLMLLGTIVIVTVSLLSPIITMGLESGFILLFFNSLIMNDLLQVWALSLLFLSLLLSVVIWPGYLLIPSLLAAPIAALATSGLLSDTPFSQFLFQYAVYIIFGVVPIYISLFASGRHAVDTLILRLEEAGYADIANYMEQNSRIGLGSFILGMLLPLALFPRWIRKGAKVGKLKITLSVRPSSRVTWSKYALVELPEMRSKEEVSE